TDPNPAYRLELGAPSDNDINGCRIVNPTGAVLSEPASPDQRLYVLKSRVYEKLLLEAMNQEDKSNFGRFEDFMPKDRTLENFGSARGNQAYLTLYERLSAIFDAVNGCMQAQETKHYVAIAPPQDGAPQTADQAQGPKIEG